MGINLPSPSYQLGGAKKCSGFGTCMQGAKRPLEGVFPSKLTTPLVNGIE
jgi:hypothetical protein